MLLERMFGQKYALIRYHLFFEVERSELERVRHANRTFRHYSVLPVPLSLL